MITTGPCAQNRISSHKLAAATSYFSSLVRTENQYVFDISDIQTVPALGTTLCLANSCRKRVRFTEVYGDIQRPLQEEPQRLIAAVKEHRAPRKKGARREATALEQRMCAKQFVQAKLGERKSWSEENMSSLAREQRIENYIAGKWVLAVERNKDGNFVQRKARRVLRGFQVAHVWGLRTRLSNSRVTWFQIAVSGSSQQ
jgi:hypothetical protein